MNTAKKWTAFSAYILFVAVVFLYVLFPSATVKTYVGHRVEALIPQVNLDIESLSLGIPPGLSFQDVAVNYLGKPAVKFENVTVTPVYLSLLTANAAAEFSGQLSGGTIHGRTGLVPGSESRDMEGEITFSGIKLNELAILETHVPAKVSGKTAGHIEYISTGKSTATVTLTECQFDLKQPIMGIGSLTFTKIDADAEMTNQRVDIKRIDFEGPQASGSGSGTVMIRQPLEASRINLSGTLKPHPSLMQSVGALFPKRYLKEGGIPVRITGTLNQPNFSIR